MSFPLPTSTVARLFLPLAHQGGWDEVLLVVAPLALIGLLLYVANRRVNAQLEKARNTATDTAGSESTQDTETAESRSESTEDAGTADSESEDSPA